jgi:hypothetical protein
MRVLVACEFSGIVRDAFTAEGHFAVSCDLEESEKPGLHYKGNVFDIIDYKWDLMIAHPPCTHLAVSGMRWFKEGCKGQKPLSLQIEAIEFVRNLMNAPIKRICIENPVSIISTKIRKPDHPEQKKTCLWLKGLPKLKETNNVYDYMMTLPIKERTRIHWLGSNHWKERSRTYQGIAAAMAEQWGNL